MALVHGQRVGRDGALGVDAELERVQLTGRAVSGERPHGEPLEVLRRATDARAGPLRRGEQVVGSDAEGGGERGEVVERQTPFAGLESAERRDVDGRPGRDGLECQAALDAQLAQQSPDAFADRFRAQECQAALPKWQGAEMARRLRTRLLGRSLG